MMRGDKYKMLRVIGFLFGSATLIFAISETMSRLNIEVFGTVISADNVRVEKGPLGNPNRFYTKYVLVDSLNGTTSEYRAGATDSDLSRNLNVGETLNKRKGDLHYLVEGNRIDDFPWKFYSTLSAVGAAFLLLGVFAHLKVKEPNHAAQSDAAKPRGWP